MTSRRDRRAATDGDQDTESRYARGSKSRGTSDEAPVGQHSATDPEHRINYRAIEERLEAQGDSHTRVHIVDDPDDPDMVIIRTRKRHKERAGHRHHRRHRERRVVLAIVAVVVAVLAGAAIALGVAVHRGDVNLHSVFGGLDNTPETVDTSDQGQTVSYDGHTYRYNDDVVAILVIGHDAQDEEQDGIGRPGATCADADMLVTIDTQTNQMEAVAVPRNSWVPVDLYDNGTYAYTQDMQLALAHAVDVDSMDACARNTCKAVSGIFYSLAIDHYVDMDMDALAEAATAIGGVELQALSDIPGASYRKGDTVLLEGDDALKYVQYRDVRTYESALDRQARQLQFAQAFAQKLRGLGVQGVLDVYNACKDDVTTNLSMSDIAYLASCLVAGDDAQMDFTSISGTTETVVESDGKQRERYYLDQDSVMQATLKAFYKQVG